MTKYSYNGIVLPELPTWDTTTYPYALVAWRYASDTEEVGDKEYLLLLQDSKETVDADGKYMTYYESGVFYRANNGEWESASLESYEVLYIVWANYDVYYLDSVEEVGGTLYLAASEPVPVSTWTPDPASLLMGYRVGQILRAMRGKKREPVAYLYNGVRLPKLPEWDKAVYPFAAIYIWTSDTVTNPWTIANLYISDVPLYRKELMPGTLFATNNACSKADGSAICYQWDSMDDATTFERYEENDLVLTAGDTLDFSLDWANYDVLDYDDGTLYLSASDPVPVYE